MDQATEAAFLAQLERKRTDMHDHMRQRRLRKAGKPPPMQQMLAAASQPPADVLTLEPSFGAAEEASEREMEEQEVEWARQKCAHARAYWATKEARYRPTPAAARAPRSPPPPLLRARACAHLAPPGR